MKLALSIADLPFNIPLENIFALAKELKIDGVEVVLGFKTRFSLKKLLYFSEKYTIPILSIHQPNWAILQLYNYDESIFKIARSFNAVYVVHPPFSRPLTSKKSQSFFLWLFRMKKKYKTAVLLENMHKTFTLPVLRTFLKADPSTTHLSSLEQTCKRFGFGITFDTSHAGLVDFLKIKEVSVIKPLIRNIHLSDFTITKQHLPLGKGMLNVKNFFNYLAKIQYKHLLTLELSPHVFYSKKQYLSDITASVSLIRQYEY